MAMKWKIMIIEDDFLLAEQMQALLCRQYEVRCVKRFDHVVADVQVYEPHLVLLDINLPGHDGFYWCEKLRILSNVPILFISARSTMQDTLRAIRLGGDDYVVKPFCHELLEAKIEAMLRRNEQYQEQKTIDLGYGLVYLENGQELLHENAKVDLTPAERRLFSVLVHRKGCLVLRTELMLDLWETDQFIEDGTLSTLVSRLRQKLNQTCGNGVILTAKGKGYYIE